MFFVENKGGGLRLSICRLRAITHDYLDGQSGKSERGSLIGRT